MKDDTTTAEGQLTWPIEEIDKVRDYEVGDMLEVRIAGARRPAEITGILRHDGKIEIFMDVAVNAEI